MPRFVLPICVLILTAVLNCAPAAQAAATEFEIVDTVRDAPVPHPGDAVVVDADLRSVRLEAIDNPPDTRTHAITWVSSKPTSGDGHSSLILLSDVDDDGDADYVLFADATYWMSRPVLYAQITQASVGGTPVTDCWDTSMRWSPISTGNYAPASSYFGAGTNDLGASGTAVTTSADTVSHEILVYDHVANEMFPAGARVGAYSLGADGLSHPVSGYRFSGFDYAPDSANPVPARPNPRPDNPNPGEDPEDMYDYCDWDGNGAFEGSDYLAGPDDPSATDPEREASSQYGFIPMDMSGGYRIPGGSTGGGTTGGGTGGGTGGTGGSTGGGDNIGGATPTPITPTAFTTQLQRGATTVVKRPMPRVTGVQLDSAMASVLRVYPTVDFDLQEVNLAKAPAGVTVGEVAVQSPSAGKQLSGGIDTKVKVTLKVYSGPKPVGAKDCLDSVAKQVKGLDPDQASAVLQKAGCKVKTDWQVAGSADENASGVQPGPKDSVTLKATLPSDPSKLDLFLVFSGKNDVRQNVGFGGDAQGLWAMTAMPSKTSVARVQVVDRAGRLVSNVRLVADNSDVGMTDTTELTDAKGQAELAIYGKRAGVVDVIAYAETANDITLYGTAKVRVIDRKQQAGEGFWSVDGRYFVKDRTGNYSFSRSGPQTRARVRSNRAGGFDWFGQVISWVGSLFGGTTVQQPLQQAAQDPTRSAQERVDSLPAGFSPAIMALSGKPIGGTPPELVNPDSNVPLTTTAGNVIAVGAGHAIPSGRDFGTMSANGVIAVGAGHLIAVGAGHLADARKGNVIAVGAGHVIAVGAGHAIDPKTGQVIAVGAGHVIAVGAGHVIAVGAGH